jgi:hypothetical protein
MAPKRPRPSNGSTITISDSPPQPKSKTQATLLKSAPATKKTEVDNSNKTSWVWRYFKTEFHDRAQSMRNICQAPHPSGSDKICGIDLAIDSSSSTRSMGRHLNRRHHLYEETVAESGSMESYLTVGKLKKVRNHLTVNLHFFYTDCVLSRFPSLPAKTSNSNSCV